MRVIYVANVDLPNRYAHALQVMKNAQAWSKACEDFEFVTNLSLRRWRKIDAVQIAELYGLSRTFRIVAYPFQRLEQSRFDRARRLYYRLAARRCRRRRADLVYTRTYLLPMYTLRFGIPTIVETHSPPEETRDKDLLYRQLRHPALLALVTISDALACRYRDFGIPGEKILVAPDGVDLDSFRAPLERDAARSQLGLPAGRFLAVYVGHLYEDRGIVDIIRAASLLPEVAFVLVGGHEKDITRWRSAIRVMALENVSLVGFVPNRLVPKYLWAADLLLMPYSSKCRTAEWMSPLKLFEYMASGRPILASDIPSLRTVLSHGRNAWLCQADDGEALARSILHVMGRPDLSEALARQALKDAQGYGWDGRVQRILEFAKGRGGWAEASQQQRTTAGSQWGV
jgi:glycosyltransferase involved in cell wall biosynthesis